MVIVFISFKQSYTPFGILVYKALTSSVTRVAPSGIVSWWSRTVCSKWLVFLMKGEGGGGCTQKVRGNSQGRLISVKWESHTQI